MSAIATRIKKRLTPRLITIHIELVWSCTRSVMRYHEPGWELLDYMNIVILRSTDVYYDSVIASSVSASARPSLWSGSGTSGFIIGALARPYWRSKTCDEGWCCSLGTVEVDCSRHHDWQHSTVTGLLQVDARLFSGDENTSNFF